MALIILIKVNLSSECLYIYEQHMCWNILYLLHLWLNLLEDIKQYIFWRHNGNTQKKLSGCFPRFNELFCYICSLSSSDHKIFQMWLFIFVVVVVVMDVLAIYLRETSVTERIFVSKDWMKCNNSLSVINKNDLYK